MPRISQIQSLSEASRDEIFVATHTKLVKESQRKLLELLCQQHERNIQAVNSQMRKQ